MRLTGKEKEQFLFALREALDTLHPSWRDETTSWVSSLNDEELAHLADVIHAVDRMLHKYGNKDRFKDEEGE